MGTNQFLMKRIIIKHTYEFVFVTFWSLLILFFICTGGKQKNNPITHKKIVYYRTCTGEVEYFDSIGHALKKYYSHILTTTTTPGWNIRIIEFSLENRSPIHLSDILRQTDFNDDDVSEVTLKNGRHYTIELLSMKDYNSIKDIDSIKMAIAKRIKDYEN